MGDSDSENEGVLNNIQRLVIRPPGHTGKAKKGHICFDGGYETMNLGRVDFITNQEYDLYIRPDTANPRVRLWFHFTVENTRRNQRVIFNIVNLSKSRNLCSQGLTPVVKSTSRPRWQRMPTNNVFYYKSPVHHDHFVLSFAFSFDREDERYSFSLAQPYSLSRFNAYLEFLMNQNFNFIQVESLTRTLQQRPLQVLTITDPEANDEKMIKKVVVILGRVRSSQTPSSFVIQGFIDFLVSDHEIAKSLRTYLIFKIIPVVNPDGVFLGNTRGNWLGQDLNRCWHNPNKFQHPTVYSIRKMIHQLGRSGSFDLSMILDVHATSCQLGLFAIGNAYNDVYRFERHSVFPKLLAQICPDYNIENSIYNNDEEKEGTVRRYFCHCDMVSPEVNSYTLEVSMLGYVDQDVGEEVTYYTDDTYCRVGRNLARAMWDYYKILGTIPLECEGSEYSAPMTSVRSFNLLRLKEVENQRIKSAQSFDEDNEEDLGSDSDSEGGRRWVRPNITPREEDNRQLLPMSIKSVIYGDEESPPPSRNLEQDLPRETAIDGTGHSVNLISLDDDSSTLDCDENDADNESDEIESMNGSSRFRLFRRDSERTWTPSSDSTGSSVAPMRVHFSGNGHFKPDSGLIIKPATTVVIRPSRTKSSTYHARKFGAGAKPRHEVEFTVTSSPLNSPKKIPKDAPMYISDVTPSPSTAPKIHRRIPRPKSSPITTTTSYQDIVVSGLGAESIHREKDGSTPLVTFMSTPFRKIGGGARLSTNVQGIQTPKSSVSTDYSDSLIIPSVTPISSNPRPAPRITSGRLKGNLEEVDENVLPTRKKTVTVTAPTVRRKTRHKIGLTASVEVK